MHRRSCFFHSVSTTIIVLLFIPFLLVGQSSRELVRVAIIEVDSTQLNQYNELLSEEIEASIRVEPGVFTLYAVAERENPQSITLFETYADSNAYRAHLATPHFQKYKQGTLQMVKRLDLIETQPILYAKKQTLETSRRQNLLARLVQLKLEPGTDAKFTRLAQSVLLPGVEKEPGLLLMYMVAEKKDPTRIRILEVYANSHAYKMHLKTAHFAEYSAEIRKMIKANESVEVVPILLGSKP